LRSKANLRTLLATDVSWQTMMDHITQNMPAGVSLTSYQGQATPPVPAAVVTPPAATSDESGSSSTETTPTTVPVVTPPPTVSGTINFQGKAKDYPTLAAWIDAMGKVPQITNVYVASAQEVPNGDGGTASGLTFTATAELTPAAQSDRLNDYVKDAQ